MIYNAGHTIIKNASTPNLKKKILLCGVIN